MYRCAIRFGAVVWVVLFLFLFSMCDDSDDFTSSPSALLSFSQDVISFDTILSSVPTSTKQLVVYNRNGEGVRIQSVQLQKASGTPFRVNVDGSYLDPDLGAVAYDFDVRSGDSIRVFIETTASDSGSDLSHVLTDTLVFLLQSGVRQQVILTAVAFDTYIWQSVVVTSDTIINTARPILVGDSLVVARDVTLTLDAGTTLYMKDGTSIKVYGTLVARGTYDRPVTFRSHRTDNLFSYLPYDNTPSRWGGITFYESSTNNVLDYVDIHASSWGLECLETSTDLLKLTLTNSVIHNIGGSGIFLYPCRASVVNTQISNTLGTCVTVVGGYTDFVHTTIAQFYPWDADRGDALFLTNTWLSEVYTLEHAYFLNCLITGYADDVVMGTIDETEGAVDFFFGGCVLRTTSSEDARFSDVTYEDVEDVNAGKGQFRTFDTDNFIYDFRLNGQSPAINAGLVQYIELSPADRDGNLRTETDSISAGAYQYVEQ